MTTHRRKPKKSDENSVHIRWMIRRDIRHLDFSKPEDRKIIDEKKTPVLWLEQECFEFAWTEQDFIRYLRQRNCIGMVAELDDKIVGFMIYELHKNRLHVLNFAVHHQFRRKSVGSQLVQKLLGKLSFERRNRIMLEIRETNLAAQLFFKSLGFRAISVLRDFYDDSPEDAYLIQHRYKPTEKRS